VSRALLDVNVLIALLDADHVHHVRAREWLGANIEHGPITQNGCVRVMSQPGYPSPLPPAQVARRLAAAAASPPHAFWPDELSLVADPSVDWNRVLGARQVTDVYLLALAVRRGGRFATFDTAVPLQAVAGARAEHLALL
jgi:uncharacterized protein